MWFFLKFLQTHGFGIPFLCMYVFTFQLRNRTRKSINRCHGQGWCVYHLKEKRCYWTRGVRKGFIVVVGLWGSLGVCVGCDLGEKGDSCPRQHVWHSRNENKCKGRKIYVAYSRDFDCTSCQSWRLILESTGRWVPRFGGQNTFALSWRIWTSSPTQSSENY